MFSGIKYIFGYSEETANLTTVNDVTAPSVPQRNDDVSAALPAETASTTKLEQTLNAATTKFTEQLLPQQASIEQLQSSSHQLLPSIIEQHEEEELKKKTSETVVAEDTDVEEDEDGFNVESWELLDLVEKAIDENGGGEVVAPVSLNTSVQKDGELPQEPSKSTSGILKSSSNVGSGETSGTSWAAAAANKLKETSVSLDKTKTRGNAMSEKLTDLVKVSEKLEGLRKIAPPNLPLGSPRGSELEKKYELAGRSLLTGLQALRDEEDAERKKSAKPAPCSSKAAAAEALNPSNGPVKRVRPARVSTSSWSSHDGEDDIEKVHNADWGTSQKRGQMVAPVMDQQQQPDNGQAVDGDDNESMISSGFSDCDYGFGGINDFVMRPKKANAKRGRTFSGSLGSTSRVRPAMPERKVAIVKAKLGGKVEAKNESANKLSESSSGAKERKSETSSSRNSKPKKKRMIMSSSNNKSVSLADFLKQRPSEAGNDSGNKEAVHTQHQAAARRKAAQVAESSSKQAGGQKASPPSTVSCGASTESSDVADMDESWFVTPPSCFTGAAKRDTDNNNSCGKADLPRAKEADRENALIEHPSVYIANAALKSQARAQSATTAKSKSVGASPGAKSSQTATTTTANASAPKPAEELLLFDEDESWNSSDDDDDDVKFDDDEQFTTMGGVISYSAVKRKLQASEKVVAAAPTSAAFTTAPKIVQSSAKKTSPAAAPPLPPTPVVVAARAMAATSKAKTVGKKSAKLSEKRKVQASAGPAAPVILKSTESKAWRNKFIVDAWDAEDNEDIESDFDNIFESNNKRKPSNKTNKRQQNQKQAKVKKGNGVDREIVSFKDGASSSVELISVKSLESSEFENNENLAPSSAVNLVAAEEQQVLSKATEEKEQQQQKQKASKEQIASQAAPAKHAAPETRRPPTQVRPIEPERAPSWQLKRQRSKRRPLVATASPAMNKQQPAGSLRASPNTREDYSPSSSVSSASSSSRSTPTLIDRIGCSIVANLTNLTSGLVSSGAMNCCPASGRASSILEGHQERAIVNKSNLANSNNLAAHVARKQLSRGSIRRQNICAKQGNSLRRPDRRLKLFATPNGCSINRKVHASIH